MTISQFFILSPRGDCIISKDFRGDEHPTMHEDFFRKVHYKSYVFSKIIIVSIGEILGERRRASDLSFRWI